MSLYLFSEMDIEQACSCVTWKSRGTLTVLHWFMNGNPSVVVMWLPWQSVSADRRHTMIFMLAGIGWCPWSCFGRTVPPIYTGKIRHKIIWISPLFSCVIYNAEHLCLHHCKGHKADIALSIHKRTRRHTHLHVFCTERRSVLTK
jgi:hypothetical protein